MARFPQLDRLADNEEWVDWMRGERRARRTRHRVDNRTRPLDEIITADGTRPNLEEDDE